MSSEKSSRIRFGKLLEHTYNHIVVNGVDTNSLSQKAFDNLFENIKSELGSLSKNSFTSVIEIIRYKQDNNLLDNFIQVKDYATLTRIDANFILLKAQSYKEQIKKDAFVANRINEDTIEVSIGSESKINYCPKAIAFINSFKNTNKSINQLDTNFQIIDYGKITDVVDFQKKVNSMVDDMRRVNEYKEKSDMNRNLIGLRDKYLLSLMIRDEPFNYKKFCDALIEQRDGLEELSSNNKTINKSIKQIDDDIDEMGSVLKKLVVANAVEYDKRDNTFSISQNVDRNDIVLLMRVAPKDKPLEFDSLRGAVNEDMKSADKNQARPMRQNR